MKKKFILILILFLFQCKLGNGFKLPFFGSSTENSGYTPDPHFKIEIVDDIPYFFQIWNYDIRFSNKVKVSDFLENISISPKAERIENFPSNSSETMYLNLGLWKFKPETEYTITIKAFEDIHGNLLENPGKFPIKIGKLNNYFKLKEGDSLVHAIESEMKQYLPFHISKLSSLDLEYGNFDLNDLIKMNTLSDQNQIFNKINTTKTKWNTNGPKDTIYQTSLDLSPYLDNKKGFLGISVSAPIEVIEEYYNSRTGNYETKEINKTKTSNVIIQSTNLGITAREDYLQSYIWAFSISDAVPQKNVEISLYQNSNKSGTCTTNSEGFCKIEKKNIGFDSKSLYYAEKGNEDKSFLLNSFNEIYQYYIYGDSHKLKPNAKLFFDRKLYRPGDTVNIKAVVSARKGGELNAYTGNIKYKIADPVGSSVSSSNKSTSAEGGIWFSYNIPDDAKLGHYNVYLTSNDGLSYSDTFQVEEFRPVGFSVDIKELEGESQKKFRVEGKYLFGSPLRNATVKYSIYKDDSYIYFPNHSNYSFGLHLYSDFDYDYSGYYSGGSEDNLDENGLYSFSLDSEGSEKKLEIDGEKIPYKKPANFRIQATVTDKDDKSVSNTKSIKVYPGKFLIGINCIDTMKPAGDKFEFDIITTNNSGNLVGDKEVEIYIMKTTWSSVKELGVSGIYYNNTKKEEIVYNTSMTIKKGPTRFEYKAKESGSYDIIVKEKDGYSISSTYFYSYKKDQFLAWDFRSDDNLQLTADRNNYKPGEKAKILVKSPFPNSKAIVTLEREKIFWQKTIEMKGNSLPLEIPIEENYLPNVYLNVMVISPRMKLPDGLSEEEIAEFKKYDLGIPKIKTGRVELKVNIDSKIAKLEVESDKPTYSPGSTVRLKIKTEPGAEIGLSVADRAVLDLVAYKFDSPINSFYSNWEHGVKMFDIRDSLIKQLNIEPKGSSPGGDYGDESGSGGFAFDSEDGSRKNFKYTAFWSPDLKADSDGYKEVEFTLPDNLTTFKIMVITSKKGKYNTTNKEIIVKKPVVVQAVLPRFLRVNDKLNMGGLIINETGKDVEFKVSFTSKELSTQKVIKNIKISKNSSSEVSFPISIKSEIIKSNQLKNGFQFSGSITAEPINAKELLSSGFTKNEIRDKYNFKVPFKESSSIIAFSNSGYTDTTSNFKEEFPSSSKVFNNMGDLNVSLSNSALIGLEKAFHFYESNPYFCMEQRTSAYLLAISSGELLKEFSFEPPDKYSYDFKNIDQLFTGEMDKFQNEDGSYRLWKESEGYGYPYLTSYVTLVHQMAKDRGKKINNSSYQKAINYLTNYLKNPKEEKKYDLENFSIIYYVLTNEKKDTSSLEKTLLDQLKDLSTRAKVYLALGLSEKYNVRYYKDNSLVEKVYNSLLDEVNIKNDSISFKKEAGFYGYFSYYTDSSRMASFLRAMIKLDKDNSAIPNLIKNILSMRSNSYWSESHGTGILALALKEYREEFEISEKDFIAKFKLNGKALIEENFPARGAAIFQKTFPYSDFKSNENSSKTFIAEKNDEDGRIYYSATLRYNPSKEILKEEFKGVKMERKILTRDGNEIGMNDFKRGEIYRVELDVTTDVTDSNFIIVDRIPSTMELVNTSFQTEENINNYSDKVPWWERSYPFIEKRDDKIVITETYLKEGSHKYSYLIRPLVKGDSVYPRGEAFFMYKPSVNGYSKGIKTSVK